MTPTNPRPHNIPDAAERPRDGALCPADFSLLARPFAEAVAFLFPEGLAVDFVQQAAAEPAPDGDFHLILAPLDLPDGGRVTMRLSTGDGGLAASLSDEWLALQAENVPRVLESARLAYIDCETELYNLRAFGPALHANAGAGVLFLLRAGWGKKSLGESLRTAADTAFLLRQHMDGALFALGHGLFAALLPRTGGAGLAQAVKNARLLQRRLRQEGLTQARMLHMETASALRLFTEGGLAGFQAGLDAAGRQGPFGLVCADHTEAPPPRFRLDETLCGAWQQEWRSSAVFSLALFRLEAPENAEFGEADLEAGELRRVDPKTLALPLPGIRPDEAAKSAAVLRGKLQANHAGAAIAVGIAGFPCLDYPKSQTPANALKALLHADLLAREQGPGRIVVFDHLTLNVSGDASFEDGDFHEALREYRRGLKLKPDDVNLLNSLGVTLAALGDGKRAAESFRAALAHEPGNHMALANLGCLLLRDGKGDEALSCLKHALAAFPEDHPEKPPGELLRPLAQLLLDKGRHEEALDVLARWAAALPVERDALHQRQLGLALKGAGRVEPALRAMERAVKLNPRDAAALGHLGDLYRLSGEGAELGLRFCRRAVLLNPEDAGLQRILGECLLACGNPDEAEEAARRCLRLNPGDGEGLWLLARILIQKKNDREARNLLNRAMKLHTISGDLKERLVRAQARLAGTRTKSSDPKKRGTGKKSAKNQ